MAEKTPVPERRGLTALQKGILVLLAVALAGSIALRAAFGSRQDASGATPSGAQGLSAASADQPATAPSPLESALPYVTEASLFGLIGFALGYSTRKLFKLTLIVIALAFVGAQALVHLGWVDIDWSGLAGKLNGWVLNLKESMSVTAFLTDRIPSAGALLAGWVVGFRRG
jgi:uncharacterized membrane protein (Fun14 family)